MTTSATNIVMAALLQASHPLRKAIEKTLANPPCVYGSPVMDLKVVNAVASDILQALINCDLGDAPAAALKRQIEKLEAENNGLILALARINGEDNTDAIDAISAAKNVE